MTDNERAKAVMGAITEFMDSAKLGYEYDEENNTAFVTITGDDFPVSLMFSANEKNGRVETYSRMPYEIKKEKAMDIAMAIAAINSRIAYGKFCLYIDKGICTYENSEYFTGLEGFSTDYGRALVAPAYSIVEEYNEKLYAVNKGLMTVKEFISGNA